MSEELSRYPKGRISIGPGDLVDVYDVQFKAEDGLKVLATLRRNPSGIVFGMKSAELTFKSYFSKDGAERDYFGKYLNEEDIQLRLKVPGLTIVLKGCLASPSLATSVENPIDMQWTVKGKWSAEKI